jgi:hypothetical protein
VAVPVLQQTADEGAMERRITRFIELAEAHSVKTDQTVLRAQPEKTISRLQDGVDGRLKQSLFLAPNAMRVLRQGLTGIKRETRPNKA